MDVPNGSENMNRKGTECTVGYGCTIMQLIIFWEYWILDVLE